MHASTEIFPVIMAGGQGSRLWPYSNPRTPKQFLKFGTEHSLFQRTLRRMRNAFDAPAVIVTTVACLDQVREQARQINIEPAAILTEPEAKGTGIAYAVAAEYLSARNPHSKMVVVPVDGYFEQEKLFCETISAAAWDLDLDCMGLLGIEPSFPHEGFGYMMPDGAGQGSSGRIARFVEKPDAETARVLIRDEGALWNCGVLLAGTKHLSEAFAQTQPAWGRLAGAAVRGAAIDGKAKLLSPVVYDMVEQGDFEKTVLLKQRNLQFWKYAGSWSDVGSYTAIGDMIPADQQNNVIIGDVQPTDCTDCVVVSPDNPVAIAGLSNVVVSVREGRVLVADRSRAQDVGNLGKKVERSVGAVRQTQQDWGQARILSEAPGYKLREITLNPKATLPLHAHDLRREHWTMVKGEAIVQLDGHDRWLRASEAVSIPAGVVHRISNPADTPLVFIELQQGERLREDDLVQFDNLAVAARARSELPSGVTRH